MDTISKRIKYIRKDLARLTQQGFARALGKERGAVSNWERGGTMSRESAELVQERFGVSLDWLLKNKGEVPSSITFAGGNPMPAIFIDQRQKPRRGDTVVVTLSGIEGGPPETHVGLYIAQEARTLRIDQMKPQRRLEFPLQRVASVQVVTLMNK